MMLRPFAALVVIVSALGLAACASEEADDKAAAEQDVAQTKLTNVKVEGERLVWGRAANYGGTAAAMRDVHAFLFDGEAGDVVVAKSSADKAGTLFILTQTDTGFVTLAKSVIADGGTQGEAKATLKKKGTYALAYQPRLTDTAPDPNALFPDAFGASLTLSGTPVSPAAKVAIAIRETWEQSTDFSELERQFSTLDPNKLPSAALATFQGLKKTAGHSPIAATWDIAGATVYVVESYYDDATAMTISFYDAQGMLVATGKAAEGTELYWTR